jgi:hypothetical protein
LKKNLSQRLVAAVSIELESPTSWEPYPENADEESRILNAIRREVAHRLDVDDAATQSETSIVGRFLVTKKEQDIASFKTPSLRNVLISAPYFHDGSKATLGTSWTTTHADGVRIPGSMKTFSHLG